MTSKTIRARKMAGNEGIRTTEGETTQTTEGLPYIYRQLFPMRGFSGQKYFDFVLAITTSFGNCNIVLAIATSF